MPDKSFVNNAALAQRTAQLEQLLQRLFAFLSRIPLERWQWLIVLLLVIWLSHSVARLFWLVIPGPTIPPATVTSVAAVMPGANPAAAEVINIAQVKNLAPFGETSAEPVAAVEAQPVPATQGIENNAADTQLNLILRGVLSSNDDKAARAIIATGDRADVYGIGDALPVGNNVTLAKVLDLRVIINNNGSFESLWMYKDDPAAKLGTAVAAPSSEWATPGGYANPPYQQQPPVFADKSPRFDSPVPSPAGDAGMAQMGKTLADVVAMSIYRENGQVVGYKIRPGRNAEMFSSLGLQTDDVVTAVNGVPLSSPGKIMEIYKSMGSATSANLEIRRGGSTVNLDVMLK